MAEWLLGVLLETEARACIERIILVLDRIYLL